MKNKFGIDVSCEAPSKDYINELQENNKNEYLIDKPVLPRIEVTINVIFENVRIFDKGNEEYCLYLYAETNYPVPFYKISQLEFWRLKALGCTVMNWESETPEDKIEDEKEDIETVKNDLIKKLLEDGLSKEEIEYSLRRCDEMYNYVYRRHSIKDTSNQHVEESDFQKLYAKIDRESTQTAEEVENDL